MQSIWTDEKIAELTRLWDERLSAYIIAEKLGVTRNAVIGKVWRLGLQNPDGEKTRKLRKDAVERKPRVKKVKLKPRINFVRESVRAVRANGNSDAMRLIKSVATDHPDLRCVEIDPLLLSLEDLKRGECRYPYGDGPFLFCGHSATEGSSYCAPHKQLTSEPPRAPIHRFARVAA